MTQLVKKIWTLIDRYTTGVPFIIWGAYGTAIVVFAIIFRNYPGVNFQNLKYILLFSSCWLIVSDIIKKKEIFNPHAHFIVDSLVYLATFSGLVYFTNGMEGHLTFVFALIAVSAPLFGTVIETFMILIWSTFASVGVNALLRYKHGTSLDAYHIGVMILVCLFYFVIAGTIKYFQWNYTKELNNAMQYRETLEAKNKELSGDIERRSKLAASLAEKTKELEDAKAGVEAEVQSRTKELSKTINMLERMNKAMYGRELKMIELKKTIRELEAKQIK